MVSSDVSEGQWETSSGHLKLFIFYYLLFIILVTLSPSSSSPENPNSISLSGWEGGDQGGHGDDKGLIEPV